MTTNNAIMTKDYGHLRPFQANTDLQAVAELVEASFADTITSEGRRYIQQMRAAARNPKYLKWAAKITERVPMPPAGFVWDDKGHLAGNLNLIPFISHRQRYYLIANVAVDSSYRRLGIARALTLAGVEFARQKGAEACWLHVRPENLGAVNLYQSLGFVERVRRTTWESRIITQNVARGEILGSSKQAIIRSPRPDFWHLQCSWLKNLYPPEVTWHTPLNLSALHPGFVGKFYRFVSTLTINQWAAWQADELLGVLSCQPQAKQPDQLWLATSPTHEEAAIRVLLGFLVEKYARHRQFVLEYPAGLGCEAFQSAGFNVQQTLIWMLYDFEQHPPSQ